MVAFVEQQFVFSLFDSSNRSVKGVESAAISRTQVSYSSGNQQYYQQQQQQQHQLQHQHHYHSASVSTVQQEEVHAAYFAEHQHQHQHQHQQHQHQHQHHQHQHQHYTPYANVSEAIEQRKLNQPRLLPQQHVNDQLKQMLADREFLRENPEPQRLQPRTSSNRSLGMEQRVPVPPPHQPHVFYPARARSEDTAGGLESQLRNSMRVNADSAKGSIGPNVLTDSTSSVVSATSSSSGVSSWQHVPACDWNIEQVGSWLHSIGNPPS